MENPPAFPIPDVRDAFGDGIREGSDGMTLRDWFAGQALAAIIAMSPTEAVQDVCSGIRGGRPMAFGAYALADAMLSTRTVDAPAGRGA
jgi:hypothetical protein